MSFHDLPQEVAEDRMNGMRREADEYRRGLPLRRRRRERARRRWALRRHAAEVRLSSIARSANQVIGAIISPSWPTGEDPHRSPRPTR
jgi:hypothetical protein